MMSPVACRRAWFHAAGMPAAPGAVPWAWTTKAVAAVARLRVAATRARVSSSEAPSMRMYWLGGGVCDSTESRVSSMVPAALRAMVMTL